MMRKYNNKTKKTIIIIIILFVIFIVIFSLFLKKALEVTKTAYDVKIGSILYDASQNMITTTKEATIKIKWGGDYYLNYDNKSIDLGKHSVVYNSNNGDIYLYGKFYEVKSNGDVVLRKDETEVKSSVSAKFYKLEDRKYLIIDRTIEGINNSFVTGNYLMVNLDKTGNAVLLNDKVSFKTIEPTKLRTSAYIFDINNEKINFGGEDIDLKKIIGSSNIYDEDTYDLNNENKEDESDISGTGTGTGNGTGTDQLGSSTGNGINNGTTKSNSSTYNNNYNSGISDSTVQEIIKGTKNTSVIRVVSDLDSITIDYVVYDPDNEYKSVYLEIENSSTGKSNIVYLSKSDTTVSIKDLLPNEYYNLTFKYTYMDGDKTREYTFDKFGIRTRIPEMVISSSKLIDNKLYYKISLNGNYNIVGGQLYLLVNGQYFRSAMIGTIGSTNEISGNNCYFDLSSLKLDKNDNNIITLKLVSLSFNSYTINPNISYKFKY